MIIRKSDSSGNPRQKSKSPSGDSFSTKIHPDAAGIDIGATESVAAVDPDRYKNPVRTFSMTTDGLLALRDHLLACGVNTAAIEATGNYWIALYDVLDEAGIAVWLCNARHVKGVPGHKTDVQDAEWLRRLHVAGLLRRSYRPEAELRPLRYLLRHRAALVRDAARSEQHMQKVLNEMNLRLHHVVSDLTGATGLRILDAILAGEHRPERLVGLKDARCLCTDAELIAALTGNYQPQYLFVLGDCRGLHRQLQTHIEEVDRQLAEVLAALPSAGPEVRGGDPKDAPKPAKRTIKNIRNAIDAPVLETAMRVLGVDASAVPGVSVNTLATFMAEAGGPVHLREHFPTSERFCSWLGLCPDNRISGGHRLGAKTRQVANRLALALRMSVQAADKSKTALGDYVRRMKARLGKAEGITAAAHKLARILYALIVNGTAYDEAKAFAITPRIQAKRMHRLVRQAKLMGMQLVPAQ